MRAVTSALICLVLAFAAVACGSDDEKDSTADNVCKQACNKIEECPSQQCTLNLDNCDAQTRAIAECVLSKPCNEMISCFQ